MTIKICNDKIEFGNYVFCQISDGICFTGKAEAFCFNAAAGSPVIGSTVGYRAGGLTGPQATIDNLTRMPFATETASNDPGVLNCARGAGSATGSDTNFYMFAGCRNSPAVRFTQGERIPYAASPGTTLTFVGELGTGVKGSEGHASGTAGYISGGYNVNTAAYNKVEKFSFVLDGANLANVLTMSPPAHGHAGASSAECGWRAGGKYFVYASDDIESFPFAADNPTTNTSDLGVSPGWYNASGGSSETHGYIVGGQQPGGGESKRCKWSFADGLVNAANISDGCGGNASYYGSNQTYENEKMYHHHSCSTASCTCVYYWPFASETTRTTIPAGYVGSNRSMAWSD